MYYKNFGYRKSDAIHGKSDKKIWKNFLGPEIFITQFLGNILMIYDHWHHQNSFLKPLEP